MKGYCVEGFFYTIAFHVLYDISFYTIAFHVLYDMTVFGENTKGIYGNTEAMLKNQSESWASVFSQKTHII